MSDCDHCGVPPDIAGWYITPDGEQLCKSCWYRGHDLSAINRCSILSPPLEEVCQHGRSLDQDCFRCDLYMQGSDTVSPSVIRHVESWWDEPAIPTERRGSWRNDWGRLSQHASGRAVDVNAADIGSQVRALYEQAQQVDPWPGESYSAEHQSYGDSVKGILNDKLRKNMDEEAETRRKVLQDLGPMRERLAALKKILGVGDDDDT